MNKEQLEEALKVIHEPITVNSVEYKYFDIDNYNKLVNVIECCEFLQENVKPYVEAQDKEIERLSKKYDKSLELLQDFNMPCDYCDCKIPDEYCKENCSVDSDCYKKCWDKYIEIELKENK